MTVHTFARNSLLALTLTGAALSANASVITRAQFDATAINFGFENVALGTTTVTSGNLTVTGGNEVGGSPGGTGNSYTNNGGSNTVAGSPIRFDFATAVSAVGFTAYYNNAPVRFDVYNSANVLLESFTSSPTDCGSICGFIGLNEGSNVISYAIAWLPTRAGIHNIYVDDVVYQSGANVPEPTSMALFGISLLGFAATRRKSRKTQA